MKLKPMPFAIQPRAERFSRTTALLILLVLTAVATFIRFFRLSQPCLWGDEALVYWRICGTYADLLKPLRNDGFGPLHYELEWLIGHFIKPTPTVLRFPPAICGVLFIPAIYFLSRKLVPRATALLAAAIATFSAFLIVYSRDAKMYSDAWFFLTANVACLLWWFRSGRWTAWLCWIAAGAAAGGIHATSLVVVGISPLFLLSQGKLQWKQSLLWFVGVILILAGPLGYYFKFNQFISNIEDDGWSRSGIAWVEIYNRGRTGPDLVRFTSTFMLMGWDWPRDQSINRIPPEKVNAPKDCAAIFATAIVIAALPWPRKLRDYSTFETAPEPPWRLLLWLSIWIVLPAYVFYCHSMPGFFGPEQWLSFEPTRGRLCLLSFTFLAAIVPLAIYPQTRSGILRFIQKSVVVAIVLGLCEILYKILAPLSVDAILKGNPWRSIWVPRYLGFIFPAICIATATFILRLPTRAFRIAITLFFFAVNLWFGLNRFLGNTEPRFDLMAADAVAAQSPTASVRTYTVGRPSRWAMLDISLDSLPGHYYLQMELWKKPMSPDIFHNPPVYRAWHGFSPTNIAMDVRHNPQLNRVIVWDSFPSTVFNAVDNLGPMLGKWKLAKENWYPENDFWNSWIPRGSLVRREYVKE